ncbi:hypothetical protein [Streptomyces sp. NPDC002851]
MGIAVAACSGPESNGSESPPASQPPNSFAPQEKRKDLALEIPDLESQDFDYPVETGNGTRDLGKIAISRSSYTLFAACTGGDKVEIRSGDEHVTEVPCDGVNTVGQVWPDARTQHIRITGSKKSHWKIALVQGTVTPS